MSDEVTVTRAEYQSLLRDRRILQALEGAGVDSWEGYEYALEELSEDDE